MTKFVRVISRPVAKAVFFLLFVVSLGGLIFLPKTASMMYDPTLGWIEVISASHGARYYLVTKQMCTPGEPIGTLQRVTSPQDTPPGNLRMEQRLVSNVLPQGTQVYHINGMNPDQAVCVALDYGIGGYVKAVYFGDKAPH